MRGKTADSPDFRDAIDDIVEKIIRYGGMPDIIYASTSINRDFWKPYREKERFVVNMPQSPEKGVMGYLPRDRFIPTSLKFDVELDFDIFIKEVQKEMTVKA